MKDENWAWLAGIVDAEGSFSLSYQIVKRGKYKISIRKARMRIKTSDAIIIPYVSYLLKKKYTRPSGNYEICLNGPSMSFVISKILPYLYIKKKQAQLCDKAFCIKSSNTPYTEQEFNEWDKCYTELKELNKRGKGASLGVEIKDHCFSFAWLAGLIDGDGTITTGKFNNNNRKPYIKISLTNHNCIKYLSEKLNLTISSGGFRGNRREVKQIRMMSNAIIKYVPKLLPYLIYKYDRANLAFIIAKLRNKQNYGNKLNDKIPFLLDSLIKLNNNKSHEFIYENGNLLVIYDITNKFININPDIMIFKDELIKRPDCFKYLILNKSNMNNPKYKIRPKSCEIKQLNKSNVESFYEKFHYQGYVNSKYHFGVFYKNKLIACISIKKPTRQLSGDWEISRMACNYDYRIYGIWSYLMKWIKNNKILTGKLITFSDNRLMSGNVYDKMGMKKSGKVNPDYYWVKGNKRYHKSGLRKKESEKLLGLTETQLREKEGYHKIYDLGKTKWSILI